MKKTILITGATDGIGKETAKKLAVEGNHIILHGRDENKVYRTKTEILNQFPQAEVDTITSDFSALANVKKMAETILENFKELDVLINNAGVYSTNKSVSQDGFELNIAVNYLAASVLTNDLLDLLIKSKPSRIINVSSIAHKRGRIDLDQFTKEKAKDLDAYKAYADSKLMLIYYTYYLADELMDQDVTVNALHPGVITTKMLVEGFNMTGEDVAKGAETPFYLATSPNVEGVTGKYFDKNIQVPSSRLSYDQLIREEVIQWTADVLKKIVG